MVQDYEGDKDLSRHRIMELDNGNKIHIERRDPYGFIHCWLDKGAWPEKSSLNGVFTTWERAYVAVDGYINERNAAVSEIRAVAVSEVKETNEDVSRPSKVVTDDYEVTRGIEVVKSKDLRDKAAKAMRA